MELGGEGIIRIVAEDLFCFASGLAVFVVAGASVSSKIIA